ncbi:hypothetical protein O3G_MSEX000827 [Manduca sexta]|nr:hypothetical protein O3G_MSEX000827 [Manduca sexta]
MLSTNSLESGASDRYGQSSLDRETKRNTQLNKYTDYSRPYNRQFDQLVDDQDSETYTTRVSI